VRPAPWSSLVSGQTAKREGRRAAPPGWPCGVGRRVPAAALARITPASSHALARWRPHPHPPAFAPLRRLRSPTGRRKLLFFLSCAVAVVSPLPLRTAHTMHAPSGAHEMIGR
jgi:hypothetical protein